MRILRAIVHPEPLLMTAGQMEIVEGRTVEAQLVGDYQLGCEALLPEQLAHEPQGGALIAPALNQYVEDLALVIDGTPQIHPLAGDANDHLASRAGGSHPHALPEPYVTLSSHTAPDVRPFACRKRQ